MNRVLISAYDVNPYSGSESATGWNFPRSLARFNKITLVTRKNNLPEIRRYIKECKLEDLPLEVVGFDLPYWARFWKKGSRGSFLYSYLWQFFVAISFLKRKDDFDLCHSLNFHCDWIPSFLWLLGKPFVWGPINHNEPIPDFIVGKYGLKFRIKNFINNMFKIWFWNFDPFLTLCKRKANFIFAGHQGVIDRLKLKSNVALMSQIATELIEINKLKDSKVFRVLYVGRDLPIKNFDVILLAFNDFVCSAGRSARDTRLTFVGVGGATEKRLQKAALALGIGDFLEVEARIPFSEMSVYYQRSSVLCFPSFEGAGLVIAEALGNGLPVLTIEANGASHELDSSCSIVLNTRSESEIQIKLAQVFENLSSDAEKLGSMSELARGYARSKLTWDAKANAINTVYRSLL